MHYLLKIVYTCGEYEFYERAIVKVLDEETVSQVVIEHMQGLFNQLDDEMNNMYSVVSFWDGAVHAQLQTCEWLPEEHAEVLKGYL